MHIAYCTLHTEFCEHGFNTIDFVPQVSAMFYLRNTNPYTEHDKLTTMVDKTNEMQNPAGQAVVTAQMKIRKPAATVFDAFIDPAVTVNFWFTHSSGKLEEGKTVIWRWDMYQVSANVLVKKIVKDTLIVVEWGEPATTIEFHFESLGANATYLSIKNVGFSSTGEKLIAEIIDNTGGFTTVVDGAKAWLEHGINLNLIADKFPAK